MNNLTVYNYLSNPVFYLSGDALYLLLRLFQLCDERGILKLNDDFDEDYYEVFNEPINKDSLQELFYKDILLRVDKGSSYMINSELVWNNSATRNRNISFIKARANYLKIDEEVCLEELIDDRRIGLSKSEPILLRNMNGCFLGYEKTIRKIAARLKNDKKLLKAIGAEFRTFIRKDQQLKYAEEMASKYKLTKEVK